jgi:hypothetical protein
MVELKLNFVNGGNPFVVGKINFGIVYDLTVKGSEDLPEQVMELEQALIMITGILKQADKSITKEVVKEKLGLDDIATIMSAIIEANKGFFEDKVDFQELNSLLKKLQKEDSTD